MGIVQLSGTHHEWKPETLWYFGAGLLTLLIGTLNFIRMRYAASAVGLRWYVFAVDLGFACYSYALGKASSLGPQIIVVVCAVAAAILSVMPARSSRA